MVKDLAGFDLVFLRKELSKTPGFERIEILERLVVDLTCGGIIGENKMIRKIFYKQTFLPSTILIMKTPLKNLKNLGPTIIRRLNEIEIYTKEDLRRVGASSAYIHIRDRHPGKTLPVCYYLYSLEGALRGVHWDDIPGRVKKSLLEKVR